jgi:hypothetical protein
MKLHHNHRAAIFVAQATHLVSGGGAGRFPETMEIGFSFQFSVFGSGELSLKTEN